MFRNSDARKTVGRPSQAVLTQSCPVPSSPRSEAPASERNAREAPASMQWIPGLEPRNELVMSEARELMTPGAWKKQGWTYKRAASALQIENTNNELEV